MNDSNGIKGLASLPSYCVCSFPIFIFRFHPGLRVDRHWPFQNQHTKTSSFLYTNYKHTEKKSENSTFHNSLKQRNKTWDGANQARETSTYNKTLRHWRKKLRTPEDGKITPGYGLVGWIFWKWPYYQKQYTAHCNLHQNSNTILHRHWKIKTSTSCGNINKQNKQTKNNPG